MIRSPGLNHFFRGKKANNEEIHEQFDKLIEDDRKYLDYLLKGKDGHFEVHDDDEDEEY